MRPPLHRCALRLWPWLAAALTGILLGLCFPPWNQNWLCWIALTPLLAALWFSGEPKRRPWLKNAALGYVSGLVFFTFTFRWLGSLAVLFHNPWLHSLPLLLALFLALYFAFWTWFSGTLVKDRVFLRSRHNLQIAFFCSAAWVGPEWARGWLFGGFGWNGIGVALHDNLTLIQIADLTGVWGLSFLVVFCNLIAVITVRRVAAEIGRTRLRPHYDFSLTMALVVLVFSYGIRALMKKEEFTPLRVAAVQPNISQSEKFDPNFEASILDQYARLTRIAMAGRPQLIVWPESAVPGGLFASRETFNFVKSLAASPGVSLMLGTDDFDENGTYNGAFLFTEMGNVGKAYHKIHLVPFGEYLPARHAFPPFVWIAGQLVPDDFQAGKEYTLLEIKEPAVKLVPLVCFEDTVGDLTRRFVLKGGQVLVNITNDGWFQKTEGAEQHLANAVFRAVETRRPLLRAANTGVTCIIDQCGRIEQSLRSPAGDPFLQGVMNGEVNVAKIKVDTFYVKCGDFFSIACCYITCVFIIYRLFRAIRGI